jgi:ABC-type phosphate transport system substrate-binding protein
MTSQTVRRMLCACFVAAIAVAAAVAPGTASASDLGQQCSGANIKGRGSTFQNPAQLVWQPGFNTAANETACSGTQGSKGTPKAEYVQGGANSGSGACLSAFGAKGETPKYTEFPFCGTDEAPNPSQKAEIESHKVGGEAKSLETIPVAQGAVAVIVHLPDGCRATSVVEKSGKKLKLGRLALDHSSVEGVYRGTIKTWKELIANQKGHASDALTCTGGEAEENTTIRPVVRLDSSGTTHIFKTYLGLVFGGKFPAEALPEEIGGKKTGCGKALPEEEKSWNDMKQGCENQRWATAANVLRPAESGNPGVVNEVNKTASSIGYADLAVAREFGFFSKKGVGGENKKGSETKQGEQNAKFWALLQDSAAAGAAYADPATNSDVEKPASSNCAGTIYTNEAGAKFPPSSTREEWNEVKAELVEKKYSICGLTYDLALREYAPYWGAKTAEEKAAGKAAATTVENYLAFIVNTKTAGGGKLLKNHDYAALSGKIVKEAEVGIKEIGWEVP